MDCRSPGSSVHGIFQARILEWVAISCPKGSSWPRGPTHVSGIFCTGRWVLHHCATWKTLKSFTWWGLENGSLTWRVVQETVRGPPFISQSLRLLFFLHSHPHLCVSDVLSQLEQVEGCRIMENSPCPSPLVAGVEPLNSPSPSEPFKLYFYYRVLFSAARRSPSFPAKPVFLRSPCFLALGPLIAMFWFLVNSVC